MEIRTIAVIGAAKSGREIAYAALVAGYRTILEDVLPERLAAAHAEILDRLAERETTSKPSDLGDERAASRLLTAGSVATVCREADLVLESLPDEVEMKIDVFCILEKFARPGAILATNATAISVTEIAAVTTRADCCVGVRFVDAAENRNVLEIVRGKHTSEETVEACREVGRRMGRDVVIVSDKQAAES